MRSSVAALQQLSSAEARQIPICAKKAAIEGAARELHLRGRRSCEKAAKELQVAAAFRFIRGATKKAANANAAQQKFDFKSQILSRKLQQKQKNFNKI